MRAYLDQTDYCDWGTAAITELARAARAQHADERMVAVALFELVRDRVEYEFGDWSIPASRTLERRAGMCTTKSNLFVALLRAAGIPAAYGVLSVDAGAYFGPIAPAIVAMGGSRSTHVYAAARLGGEWVRCDPSTDRRLADKTSHYCRQTTLVEWDGTSEAMDQLDPDHIHADFGIAPQIDDLVGKRPSQRSMLRHSLYNYYLGFVRDQRLFSNSDETVRAVLGAMQRDEPEMWSRCCRQLPDLVALHGFVTQTA